VSTPTGPPVTHSFHVPDDQMGGAYSNLLSVWHSPYEFTLDFAVTLPAQAAHDEAGGDVTLVPSVVVSRIKIPPAMVFAVMQTLNENMTRYEATFGSISGPAAGGTDADEAV
jgi:hypothetical protein